MNKLKYVKVQKNYLQMNISNLASSLFSQIQFGILPIEIEVGRYRHKPVEERFCYHRKGEIEEELHFLFSCKAYRNLRNNLPCYGYCELNTADKKIMYFNNLLRNNSTTRVLSLLRTHMRCVICLYINSGVFWVFASS